MALAAIFVLIIFFLTLLVINVCYINCYNKIELEELLNEDEISDWV